MKRIAFILTSDFVILIISVIVICVFFYSCMTPTQKGALGGGTLGGIAGQLIGGNTESTMLGMGIGALGGALANDYVDQQKQQAQRQGYNQGTIHRQVQYGGTKNRGYDEERVLRRESQLVPMKKEVTTIYKNPNY